jgi:hypothetical protein
MLWLAGGIACLLMAAVCGAGVTASLGWTGIPGTMTARKCYQVQESRGGTHTDCDGTFTSADGTLVDPHASIVWDDGKPGEQRTVQKFVLGGYQGREMSEVLLTSSLTAALAAAFVGCVCAASTARAKRRWLQRTPFRCQQWYLREWT